MPVGPALQGPGRRLCPAALVRPRWPPCRSRDGPGLLQEVARSLRPGLPHSLGSLPGHQQGDPVADPGHAPTAGRRAPSKEIEESEALAAALLADRARWPAGFKEDETLWHPATAGEAYLLRRLWDAAAQQYGDALKSRYINAHARMAVYKQVERIRMCFAILGVEIPPPLGDPKTFFSVGPSTGRGGARPRQRHQAQRLGNWARIPEGLPDTSPARGCLSSSTWKGREHGSPNSAHRPPPRAPESGRRQGRIPAVSP